MCQKFNDEAGLIYFDSRYSVKVYIVQTAYKSNCNFESHSPTIVPPTHLLRTVFHITTKVKPCPALCMKKGQEKEKETDRMVGMTW